jgi:hypothetical protein
MSKTMITTVSLLGTGLKINKGEKVIATRAKNLDDGKSYLYFVRPLRGKWSDGITRNLQDSILVSKNDFQ